jgi:hypothetical protein
MAGIAAREAPFAGDLNLVGCGRNPRSLANAGFGESPRTCFAHRPSLDANRHSCSSVRYAVAVSSDQDMYPRSIKGALEPIHHPLWSKGIVEAKRELEAILYAGEGRGGIDRGRPSRIDPSGPSCIDTGVTGPRTPALFLGSLRSKLAYPRPTT